MTMILPKGIVVNAPEAANSIEQIDAEPLDPADIAKFWKVYTTTKRRLLDPTAERLENYWWRIWGSRSRELNGVTIARLFAHISDGQSFVPLRGPANRDEGTSPMTTGRHAPGGSRAAGISNRDKSRPSTTSSSTTSKTPAMMPPPILKKSPGPTASGPRPTARFISPHESEFEHEDSADGNSHVTVQPPSPTIEDESQISKIDKKAGSGAGKKHGFLASTASKKKRPAIIRRKSSQSSGDSITKAAEDQSGARQSSSDRDSLTSGEPTLPRTKLNRQSKFQENLSPPRERSPRQRKTTKTTDGKRPPILKPSSGMQRDQRGRASDLESTSNGDPGPSTLRSVQNKGTATTEEDLSAEELEELEMQRILLAEANARMQKTTPAATHAVLDSNRNAGSGKTWQAPNRSASDGHLNSGVSRYLPHEHKSVASLAPTLTEVTGELNLGDDESDVPRTVTPMHTGKGKGRDPEDVRSASMFAKRPVPSIPKAISAAPNTSSTLARSKSQLTLLLERDRARSGEHNPNEDPKKEKKKK